jgi:arginyl-tRNA synthetase
MPVNPIRDARRAAKTMIGQAVAALCAEAGIAPDALPPYKVDEPADRKNGDFAANAAMVWARTLKKSPRAIAEAIVAGMSQKSTAFDRVEVAGPGFINFYLADGWYTEAVKTVLRRGEGFGRSDFGQGKRVNVEFVSANPTGPMHMGNARGGAIGDCLAAAMDWAGYDVTREFYINDAGNQIEKFGLSLEARYLQHWQKDYPFPEDGYQGLDIVDHAEDYIAQYGDRLLDLPSKERQAALVDYALPKNIAALREDLGRYRIEYDVWFKESSLYESGAVEDTIKLLIERGLTYEKDGALWVKASEFGSDKDEVLVRQNGIPTYFAADIAYHINKFARGFDLCINVWGADHHGHVARMKGAMDAVGLKGDKLTVIIMQLVRLMREGQVVKMSKRTGRSVTLSDLMEDVSIDAARFFFNMREPGSPLDFDLDLANLQDSQNPVFYVQYAHARIVSILKNMSAEGISPRPFEEVDFGLLIEPQERQLIWRLSMLPEVIIAAAQYHDPAKLTHYIVAAATDFHRFYDTCRCRVEDKDLMQARLNLCLAAQVVLKNTLSMLKIDAPDRM